MNTRRPAHAAGKSWRKWEDPMIQEPYNENQVVTPRAIDFWLACIVFGAIAALLVSLSAGN